MELDFQGWQQKKEEIFSKGLQFLPKEKMLGPEAFTGELCHTFRKEYYQFHINSPRKLKRKEYLPTHSMRPEIY